MVNIKQTGLLSTVILGLMVSSGANAGLIDRGNGMIFDDDLNITWLADANYAATSGYAAANTVANGGSDINDIRTDGRMGWGAANAWATGLSYGGYDDWRLPTAMNVIGTGGAGPCSGYNCGRSELGHLYYGELSGTAYNSTGYTPVLTSGDPDLALFSNIGIGPSPSYWTDTQLGFSGSGPGFAYGFNFAYGLQGAIARNGERSVWAVRSGDVGAVSVPEPGSMLLMAAGLVGVVGARRRRCRQG